MLRLPPCRIPEPPPLTAPSQQPLSGRRPVALPCLPKLPLRRAASPRRRRRRRCGAQRLPPATSHQPTAQASHGHCALLQCRRPKLPLRRVPAPPHQCRRHCECQGCRETKTHTHTHTHIENDIGKCKDVVPTWGQMAIPLGVKWQSHLGSNCDLHELGLMGVINPPISGNCAQQRGKAGLRQSPPPL